MQQIDAPTSVGRLAHGFASSVWNLYVSTATVAPRALVAERVEAWQPYTWSAASTYLADSIGPTRLQRLCETEPGRAVVSEAMLPCGHGA